VLTLVRGLPDGSHLAAAVRGGVEHRGWTLDRHLLASMFDAVQANTVVNARIAAGKKASSIKDPQPWPRPGEVKRRKPRTLADMIARRKR
jgi:hypothetical protein